ALATLESATLDRLRPLLPDGVVINNPLDHTNGVWAETDTIRSIVEVLAEDPGVNQILYVQDVPVAMPEVATLEWKQTRDGLVEADIPGITKAVAAGLPELMPLYVADELASRDVTPFAGIPDALRALGAHTVPSASASRMRAIAACVDHQDPGEW